MPLVSARDIVMAFPMQDSPPLQVLHGVSLDLQENQLTMLVGPSGCGKTTLLSILAGILSPTAGEVEIAGERLFALSDREKVRLRRRAIGFIFQQYNLLPALTAAENAAMPLVAAGMALPRAATVARDVLASIGMEGQTEKRPSQLSGGQQQRVAIARALVHSPRLVVCDEPTAALDAATGRTVLDILSRHARQPGRAVLVVTHDNRIYSYADRIVAMEDGRITGTLPTPAEPLHA